MDIHELPNKLDQIRIILQQNKTPSLLSDTNIALSDYFVAFIRKAVKPGMAIERNL